MKSSYIIILLSLTTVYSTYGQDGTIFGYDANGNRIVKQLSETKSATAETDSTEEMLTINDKNNSHESESETVAVALDPVQASQVSLDLDQSIEVLDTDQISDYSSTLNKVDEFNDVGVRYYPNPTRDLVTIEIEDLKDFEFVNLYTLSGKLILHKRIQNVKLSIDLSTLADATYICEVKGSSLFKQWKIVKHN